MVPGLGIVIGAGALASALGGVAATAGAGAAAGAIVGYLKENGIDDETADEYEEAVASGGAILAVTVPSGTVDEDGGERRPQGTMARRTSTATPRGGTWRKGMKRGCW